MSVSGVSGYNKFPQQYGYGLNVDKRQEEKQQPTQKVEQAGDVNLTALKRAGVVPCETCSSRRYQDGSDDPGVSFKSPGYIDPSVSGAVVMAHEQEHVTNEAAKAAKEDREIIGQSVRLFTANCPECGRTYVSGGETTTVSRNKGNNYSQSGLINPKAVSGQFFDAAI